MSEAVRWTIKVSRETDLALRTLLGSQGMKKGDLSNFVEDAVRWRVFDRRVQGLRHSMREVPAAELQDQIDAAVRDVRRSAKRRKK